LTARLEAQIEAEIKPSNGKFEVFRNILAFRMDIHQARTDVIQEIIAKMDAHQERMGVSVNAWRKETTASHETTETCLESKEQTAAVHEVVPKDEASAKTVRALKKRYGDRHLALGRRREETDPRRWWLLKKVGRRPQDDPPCHYCTAQGTRSSGTRQGQYNRRSP
jgi:hypothetical protein